MPHTFTWEPHVATVRFEAYVSGDEFLAGARTLGADPRFGFMAEGVNTHWFATGFAEPVIGNMANNVSVRLSTV